jgi:hypothetical protein
MFGLVLAGYHYGNLTKVKMSDDIEKIRINVSKGTVSLLDSSMTQVAARKFDSVKERKKIMDFWHKTYHLEGKKYCIIISHN